MIGYPVNPCYYRLPREPTRPDAEVSDADDMDIDSGTDEELSDVEMS